jgi:hypothetical protein
MNHANISDIATYLRAYAQELGERILESYLPLHAIDDPPPPLICKLLRKPYPAQTLASWAWSGAGSRLVQER